MRRVLLTLVTAALVLPLAGCTQTGERAPANQQDATSASEDTGGSGADEMGAHLIARPDLPFQVTFEFRDPYSGDDPQYFVWRQGNGMRRWDEVLLKSGQPYQGWLSLETLKTHLPPGVPGVGMGDPILGCSWGVGRSLAPGQVEASCDSSGRGGPWDFVLAFGRVEKRLPDQTIAGRTASCYSLITPHLSISQLCVDASQGIPLALVTEGLEESSYTQVMRAVSVSMAEPNLIIPPIELGERDPISGLRYVEAVLPASSLQLPDLSAFEE